MSLAALPAPQAETVAQRVRRLQAEARGLARDHVRALAAAMIDAEHIAHEIAEGGDAYPVGVREIARRLAEDLDSKVNTLAAIVERRP